MVGRIVQVSTDESTGKLLIELVGNEKLTEDERQQLRPFADSMGDTNGE